MKLDGTVLGFDVGARRIGVAVGSAFGTGARALAVVDVHGHGRTGPPSTGCMPNGSPTAWWWATR